MDHKQTPNHIQIAKNEQNLQKYWKMLIQGPCDPRRHYFLLMFLTSNLESMAYKPFCTGVLSTQRSCARCKAGVASQRRANFSAGMSFASLKHGEGIVNWIHHSLHIFHRIVIKISLWVSENLDGVSQTLKNRNQWSRSMLGDPTRGGFLSNEE